ncbi:unnamed protein product, partial [Rotaria sp. Silwood2]
MFSLATSTVQAQ